MWATDEHVLTGRHVKLTRALENTRGAEADHRLQRSSTETRDPDAEALRDRLNTEAEAQAKTGSDEVALGVSGERKPGPSLPS